MLTPFSGRISMNTIKLLAVYVLMSSLFLSCTKDKPASPVGATGPGEGSDVKSSEPYGRVPEIISASISPQNPTVNMPLRLEYDGCGEQVRCTFRWYVGGSVVQEGENALLAPGSYRKGDTVFVEIVPSSMSATGRPFKTEARQIGNTPPEVVSIELKSSSPLPVPGDTITATPKGTDADDDRISYQFEWTVNGASVTGQPSDNDTFNTTGLRKKDTIIVAVTPSDGESKGPTKLSDPLFLANRPPRIVSTPPAVIGAGVYSYQVSASDPDGDRVTYGFVTAPEGMSIDPSNGMISWTLPVKIGARMEIPVKIKVEDGDGGIADQEYTILLEKTQ